MTRNPKDPVGLILKRTQQALRIRLDAALEKHDVTAPQYAALAALEHEPGLSNAELARRSFVTPQTMLRIVEGLERDGLVERAPHETHGRVLQARLTARGKRLVVACHPRVDAVEEEMLQDLSLKERDVLRELLERCLGRLG